MLGSGCPSSPPQPRGVPRAPSTFTAAASPPVAPGSATPRPHASSCTVCTATGTASASARSEGWGCRLLGAGVATVTRGKCGWQWGDYQGCVLPAPRSLKCPSCCLQPTSSSSPVTPRASLSPPPEGLSTSCSCWSRGAANTCTHCSRPQVWAGGSWGGAGGSWAPHPPPSLPCPQECLSLSWGFLCPHGQGGRGAGCPWGFGAPNAPLSPRVSAGCSEAVYLLAPSADGHWLAAVSGDWAIHIYNLKCFKVGLEVTPSLREWGAQQAGPPGSHHCIPRAGLGRVCGKGGVRGSPGGSGQVWVCGRGGCGGPGGSHQGTVPSCSITAWCPPTTAPYRPSPSTPAPTTSSSPTRTSRWELSCSSSRGPAPFPVPASLPSELFGPAQDLAGPAAGVGVVPGADALSQPVSPLCPCPHVQLSEFSIPEKQYTSWSRAVQSRGLHRAWLERDSPITHITFNPKNPAHILLHDTYLLCVLDKSLVSRREGWGARPVFLGSTADPAVPALAAPARRQRPPDEPEHPETAPRDRQEAAAPRLQDLQEVPGGC